MRRPFQFRVMLVVIGWMVAAQSQADTTSVAAPGAKPAVAKGRYIRSITMASTMGPGVKIDPSRTRDILEEAATAAA